jgi:maltooligosyltrehalose trehalohydrolase
MPFGPEPLPEGGTRFRLWAPDARGVELCLAGENGESEIPMEPAGGGWYRLDRGDVGPGALYRFRIDGELRVPDPASRCQPHDVHGPSLLTDPGAYLWRDTDWTGRPWNETVLYELHVGAFTRDGTFDAARERLPHLARLGVTAVELMPLSDFPGRRDWGYDGVLPFAPDAAYGGPDSLKRFVEAAHALGLQVLLDVVYNHFGPDGNYLHVYARPFFHPQHRTPWGAAINLDGEGSETARAFFIHNALYWIEEFHLDGLRLDAVHAMHDESRPGFLEELERAVREGPGAERPVHLVLENDANEVHRLKRGADPAGPGYVAQWNDDLHHALHCLLTGEEDGYYADYASAATALAARALAEGFAYQGEPSAYRDGRPRGEPSRSLPATAFVDFLQNHDQVGNRALGERLDALAVPEAVDAALAVILLAPAPPLLFMGEEWGTRRPFPFFCDFEGDLARAVSEGRRNEFRRFARFRDEAARREIPDPNAEETFASAVLDWEELGRPPHRSRLSRVTELLALRHREIVPRLANGGRGVAWRTLGPAGFHVRWILGDGSSLTLLANLGEDAQILDDAPAREPLHATPGDAAAAILDGTLPARCAAWWIERS